MVDTNQAEVELSLRWIMVNLMEVPATGWKKKPHNLLVSSKKTPIRSGVTTLTKKPGSSEGFVEDDTGNSEKEKVKVVALQDDVSSGLSADAEKEKEKEADLTPQKMSGTMTMKKSHMQQKEMNSMMTGTIQAGGYKMMVHGNGLMTMMNMIMVIPMPPMVLP